MYVCLDKISLVLCYFGFESYYLRVVLGVDGVFFGKDDEVIFWFVLFFNVG